MLLQLLMLPLPRQRQLAAAAAHRLTVSLHAYKLHHPLTVLLALLLLPLLTLLLLLLLTGSPIKLLDYQLTLKHL
jgi:hypothetical protein